MSFTRWASVLVTAVVAFASPVFAAPSATAGAPGFASWSDTTAPTFTSPITAPETKSDRAAPAYQLCEPPPGRGGVSAAKYAPRCEVHTYFVAEREGAPAVWVHNASPVPLQPTELNVGTFGSLRAAGTVGDEITPHHMPPDSYMRDAGIGGYTTDGGVAMNTYHPPKGSREQRNQEGRHQRTDSFKGRAKINYPASLPPRVALARAIKDERRIHMEDGLYDKNVRHSLRQVVRSNRALYREFGKPPGGC